LSFFVFLSKPLRHDSYHKRVYIFYGNTFDEWKVPHEKGCMVPWIKRIGLSAGKSVLGQVTAVFRSGAAALAAESVSLLETPPAIPTEKTVGHHPGQTAQTGA
jgi:hypothetical protein